MRATTVFASIAFASSALLVFVSSACHQQTDNANQSGAVAPFYLPLGESDDYQPIVEGAPRSRGMESGRVALTAGAVGELHSTKQYEEIIVLLQGSGELRTTGGRAIAIHAPGAVYVPPSTEHAIANTSQGPLVYVYVAAPTRAAGN